MPFQIKSMLPCCMSDLFNTRLLAFGEEDSELCKSIKSSSTINSQTHPPVTYWALLLLWIHGSGQVWVMIITKGPNQDIENYGRDKLGSELKNKFSFKHNLEDFF